MKYVYVTFGQPKQELLDMSGEDMKKMMAGVKKKAKEERDVHMDFYGSPWGVSEGFVVIWKSDKPLSEFAGVNSPIPWTETRTMIFMSGE